MAMHSPTPVATSAGARHLAHGCGWRATELVCTAGPGDRPFEERHEHVTIAGVLEGCFTYRAGNTRTVLHTGALLLGNACTCYECSHEYGSGDRCIAIRFDRDFFSEIAASVSGSGSFRFPVPAMSTRPAITSLFSRIVARASSSMARDTAVARLAELVIEGTSDGPTRTVRISPADERRISAALRYIEAHASDDMSLDDIADAAGTSKYHFLRTFRRHVGVTPYRYVLELRLRRAAVALATTAKPVSTIALDVGFGDLSTFSRRFGAAFGLSPRRFRDREGRQQGRG